MNGPSTIFWATLAIGKNLVQVILTRILLGMNLVQDFELDLFYYLRKNSTRNEPSTRFWAIFVLEKPSPSYLKRILIVMNLVQDYKKLVQVIGKRILPGINLVQDTELDWY